MALTTELDTLLGVTVRTNAMQTLLNNNTTDGTLNLEQYGADVLAHAQSLKPYDLLTQNRTQLEAYQQALIAKIPEAHREHFKLLLNDAITAGYDRVKGENVATRVVGILPENIPGEYKERVRAHSEEIKQGTQDDHRALRDLLNTVIITSSYFELTEAAQDKPNTTVDDLQFAFDLDKVATQQKPVTVYKAGPLTGEKSHVLDAFLTSGTTPAILQPIAVHNVFAPDRNEAMRMNPWYLPDPEVLTERTQRFGHALTFPDTRFMGMQNVGQNADSIAQPLNLANVRDDTLATAPGSPERTSMLDSLKAEIANGRTPVVVIDAIEPNQAIAMASKNGVIDLLKARDTAWQVHEAIKDMTTIEGLHLIVAQKQLGPDGAEAAPRIIYEKPAGKTQGKSPNAQAANAWFAYEGFSGIAKQAAKMEQVVAEQTQQLETMQNENTGAAAVVEKADKPIG